MKLIINSKAVLIGGRSDLKAELQQLFTLANPIYGEAEKRGRRTVGIPKFLHFAEATQNGLELPRGAGRVIHEVARRYGPVALIDHRLKLGEIDLHFKGDLRPYQQQAIAGAMAKDFSVLEAGTGSGKTVMALAIIAARRQPTLIIVHTKELLYQWRDRIQQFLGLEAGLIGDGRLDVKPVTVGIVNSVKKTLPCLVDHFGHLVVDECHRVPSGLFSGVVTAFSAKYCLGLSATPLRRDGLTALIGWFVGLHKQSVEMSTLHKVGAVLRPRIVDRETGFRWVYDEDYQDMISALVADPARNNLIAGDIRKQAEKGGLAIVVSDRISHLQALAEMVGGESEMLTGKTPAKKRREIVGRLAGGAVPVLFSTLSLIGEGFDCPSMDSLFLATPIKFSGRLTQTIGRVLRPVAGKEPLVFDYHDGNVGILQHQWRCRQKVFLEMR